MPQSTEPQRVGHDLVTITTGVRVCVECMYMCALLTRLDLQPRVLPCSVQESYSKNLAKAVKPESPSLNI